MNEAEKILEKYARKNMIQWNQELFKRTHTKLHKSIIEAINEALCIRDVRDMLTDEVKEFIYQNERKKYEGTSWEVELDHHKETFMSGIEALNEFLNNRPNI